MALTYTHECSEHGRFEVVCSIKETTSYHPCPECAAPAPKRVVLQPDQIGIPAHFSTTLPTTGMKDNQGRSGEWENLHRHFNRWDSGASGMRDGEKGRATKLKRQEETVRRVASAIGG